MRQTLELVSFTGGNLSLSDHVVFRITAESEVQTLPAFTQGLLYARLMAHPAVNAVSCRPVEVVAELREALTDETVAALTDIVRRTLEASDAGLPVKHYTVDIKAAGRTVYRLGVYSSDSYLGFSLGMLDFTSTLVWAFDRAAADLSQYFRRTSTADCKSVMHITVLPDAPNDIHERLTAAMLAVLEADRPTSITGLPVAFVVGPLEPKLDQHARVVITK